MLNHPAAKYVLAETWLWLKEKIAGLFHLISRKICPVRGRPVIVLSLFKILPRYPANSE
jgi:hypothetical protein